MQNQEKGGGRGGGGGGGGRGGRNLKSDGGYDEKGREKMGPFGFLGGKFAN